MNVTSIIGSTLLVLTLICSTAIAGEDTAAVNPQAHEASDAEIAKIRQKVLRRCGLSSRLAANKLPWYFHYEYGIELMNSGAVDQAIEPLQMTANLRSEPARGARMYGMWFVNYLPYYQMSRAYSELGDWENAWYALQLSQQTAEYTPGDFEYEKFTTLKQLIEQNRAATG